MKNNNNNNSTIGANAGFVAYNSIIRNEEVTITFSDHSDGRNVKHYCDSNAYVHEKFVDKFGNTNSITLTALKSYLNELSEGVYNNTEQLLEKIKTYNLILETQINQGDEQQIQYYKGIFEVLSKVQEQLENHDLISIDIEKIEEAFSDNNFYAVNYNSPSNFDEVVSYTEYSYGEEEKELSSNNNMPKSDQNNALYSEVIEEVDVVFVTEGVRVIGYDTDTDSSDDCSDN